MDNKLQEYGEFFEKMCLTELSIEDGAFKVYMKREGEVYIPPKKEIKPVKEVGGVQIKAPLLGTCHIVKNLGDTVKKGDVLCNIEAMKMFNEIVSSVDGKIAEICVKDGELVEYEQVLYVIDEVN